MNTFEMIDDSPPPPPPALLSVDEAAAALGIKRSTLYKLIAAGEIGTVKISGRRRLTAEQIRDYIDAHSG